jgi:hypothetical protein
MSLSALARFRDTGKAGLVRTPEEIAEYSLVLAKRATDELAEYIGPLPEGSDEEPDVLFEAEKALPRDRSPRKTPITRHTWELHAASQLLMAVGHVLQPRERSDEDEDLEEDAWEALRAGDIAGARVASARMFEVAVEIDEDDWHYGNLVHWGHIILGHACLQEDDVVGAQAELRAAGRTPGSPQLNSFGPDLWLAWTLLKQGEDEAVLDYLHEISRFWSTRGRRL